MISLAVQYRRYKLRMQKAGSAQPALDPNAFIALVVELYLSASLTIHVADAQRIFAYPILTEASACSSWSLIESIGEALFVTRPHLLRHASIEVLLSGQPLYVFEDQFDKACRLRPTPDASLMKIINVSINEAVASGTVWIKKELVAYVLQHPEVVGVKKKHIQDLLKEIWPTEWSNAGRRSAHKVHATPRN